MSAGPTKLYMSKQEKAANRLERHTAKKNKHLNSKELERVLLTEARSPGYTGLRLVDPKDLTVSYSMDVKLPATGDFARWGLFTSMMARKTGLDVGVVIEMMYECTKDWPKEGSEHNPLAMAAAEIEFNTAKTTKIMDRVMAIPVNAVPVSRKRPRDQQEVIMQATQVCDETDSDFSFEGME